MRRRLSVWRNRLGRMSIAVKMAIVMMLATALVLTLFLAALRYYNSFSFYQKLEGVSVAYLDSIDQIVGNLTSSLDSYSRICFSNAAVQNVLEKEASGQTEFSLRDDVNNYLDELVANIIQIDSIYLYGNDTLIASADQKGNHYPKHRNLREFDWYSETEGGEYYIDFSSDDFVRGRGENPEISFRRVVRSLRTFQQIGYLIMTVSSEELSRLLVPDDSDRYESVFCLFNDRRDVIVVSDQRYRQEMQKIGTEMIAAGEKMRICGMDGQKYMFCILESEDRCYMGAVSIDDAYRADHSRNFIEIFLVVLQIIVTLACIIVISGFYTRPLRRLMESMRELQSGSFQPMKLESEQYEIKELVKVYNDMVREINLLIRRTKEAERMKGQADLKALTAQINPHFLYNTFDSIKALFMLKRYDDAYSMIDSLSRFYKINLSKGDDFITVERNLAMIRSYVDIQRMRFGGEFSYADEVDEEVLQWKILKFTLQPLVENAINHGIHGYTSQGVIRLVIRRTGESRLRICLEDNGRGMSEEVLSRALAGEAGEYGKSFGLLATFRRLEYCYEDRMSWKIDSEEAKGTRITIELELEECLCH